MMITKRVAIVFLLTMIVGLSLAEQPYKVIELGTLGYYDNWYTEAQGINDIGQVVGWSKTASGQTHAFFWQAGVMTDLGTFGGQESYAYAINENGQVTGWADMPSGANHAFIWDKVNGMRDLGLFTGYAINDSGQIAGSTSSYRASLWDPQAGIRELSSQYSGAYGINDAGQIAGGVGNNRRASIWDDSGIRDLGTLGGTTSQAYAINEAGQVVGFSATSTDDVHPFLWDAENGMVDLRGITGDTGWAYAINDLGQVVGGSHVNYTAHVFLWDKIDGVRDISGPLGLTGYLIAQDINNKSQIVAGRYVLSPIPEPSMLLLFGIGSLALRKWKSKN